MGAQDFNFARKFPQNANFTAPNFAVLDENFLKFLAAFNLGEGAIPPLLPFRGSGKQTS